MTKENENDEQLPGGVSNQNAEEQPTDGNAAGEKGGSPGTGGSDDKSGGESSEGTQSTGHPSGAG
jgi:hypothetical protein